MLNLSIYHKISLKTSYISLTYNKSLQKHARNVFIARYMLCTCQNAFNQRYTTKPNRYNNLEMEQLNWKMILNKSQLSNLQFRFIHQPDKKNDEVSEVKLSMYQRLKKLFKEYWYVTVPVHCMTSAVWFGGFYYAARSGVDVISWLEYVNSYLNFDPKYIDKLKDSSMGYVAIAYALYKIFTPLRYTVTLGGTTFSIKYLKKRGIIKPMPSGAQLKEMYEEKKTALKDNISETRDEIKLRKQNLQDDLTNYYKEIKSIEDKKK